jgi:transcriptional regulator with XRE-family HTH domain
MSCEIGVYGRMRYLEKIDDALRRRLLKRADLARLTGFSPSRISKWFNGQGKPDLYQAAKMARVLDVPLEYLTDDTMNEIPMLPSSELERALWHLVRRAGVEVAFDILARSIRQEEPKVIEPAVRMNLEQTRARMTRKGAG